MYRKLKILLNRAQRRRMALLLLAMSFGAGLELVGIGAIPAFVRLLVEPHKLLAALPADGFTAAMRAMDLPTLTLSGAALLMILFLLKNLYFAGMLLASTRLIQGIRAAASQRLFRAYLLSPYTFHLQRNPAQLINTIYGETGRATTWVDNGMRLLREGLVLLVIFALLVVLDPQVSLGVFAIMVTASGLFYLGVRRSLRRRGKEIQKHWEQLTQIMNQGLGAIKEAKILGRESYLMDRFDHETRGIRRHDGFQQMVSGWPRLFLEVLAVSAVLIVVAAFVLLGRSPQSLLPVLALLAIASVRLVPSLSLINAALANLRYNLPALELVCSELATLEKSAPPATAAGGTAGGSAWLQSRLELYNVHYRYPQAAMPALAGVSLAITPGEVVGIIGPSGAGKSTLIDVILGLLSPTQGEVRVDGRDIQPERAAWQRQIGYVPQDIYLLDDTIRRNIAFGLADEAMDEAAMDRAVRAAQIDAFVQTLPAGLGTVIGNRGIRLSGGQRQRIGIARALYHNPGVLVLDEATSSLDSETEREVIAAINRLRGDRTIIMIAHRLTTVQGCDRLYLLEDGRVKDEGIFAELLLRHPHLGLIEPAVSRSVTAP